MQRLSLASSSVTHGGSGTSTVGTTAAAKPPLTMCSGTLAARATYPAAASQSCGAPMEPTTPATQAFSSATCSTTARVSWTRCFSRSRRRTRPERCEAVSEAVESMLLEIVRAAIACAPRVARRLSRRPSERERVLCEERRVSNWVVRAVSRVCRADKAARISLREVALRRGAEGSSSCWDSGVVVDFWLGVVVMVAFDELRGFVAEEAVRERPLGRTADIETVLGDNGGALLRGILRRMVLRLNSRCL